MSTYTNIKDQNPITPIKIITINTNEWSTNWSRRPKGEVAIGLRLLSEEQVLVADSEAIKESLRDGRPPQYATEKYYDIFSIWAVAYATCDPNNAQIPYFDYGDEDVRAALTPGAIKRIYEQIELAHITASPTRKEISDQDLNQLIHSISNDISLQKDTRKIVRIRRILQFCHEIITGS